MISVIDTNVVATANLRADHASKECVLAAIDELSQLRRQGIVGLDDGLRILTEYRRHASATGQPGLGDMFYRHLLDNIHNALRCRIVPISASEERGFEEFPADPALNGFDEDDRKFVAVALGCGEEAEIVNAIDSDWWDFHDELTANGVSVRFICPDMVGGT